MDDHPPVSPRRKPYVWLCVVLLLGLAIPVQAQPEAPPRGPEFLPEVFHTLRAADYDARTVVAPPEDFGKRAEAETAQIIVTYNNFPEEAQRAFQLAADLWETHVESPVPIRIEANWQPLGQGVLGSAGPALFANFQNAPAENTWFAAALADALAGVELDEGAEPDVFAFFNSDFPNWYFRDDLDGGTPVGVFDFTTVVFHEIGHGLGFTGSFTLDDGISQTGDECPGDDSGVGCWGYATGDGRLFPIVFDRFAEDADEVALLNTNVYPNPSVALADALESEALFFESAAVRSANRDIPVDLYAPQNFETGSSFSHLGEQQFPPGNPNSLMTPFLGRAETIFSPGPVTCAIFQDLGWPLGPDCLGLLGSGLVSFVAEAQDGDALLSWTTVGTEKIDRFIVEQRFFDEAFVPVDTVQATGTGERPFSIQLDDLASGQYTYRIVEVRANGSQSLSPQQSIFIPLRRAFQLTEVYPNPFQRAAQLTLQVSATQRVRATLYDVQGREVADLTDQIVQTRSLLRIRLDAGLLGSGIYFVRVTGEDFAETRSAVVVK